MRGLAAGQDRSAGLRPLSAYTFRPPGMPGPCARNADAGSKLLSRTAGAGPKGDVSFSDLSKAFETDAAHVYGEAHPSRDPVKQARRIIVKARQSESSRASRLPAGLLDAAAASAAGVRVQLCACQTAAAGTC